MDGEIEHSLVPVELPLGGLAVVDVPVHYEDALHVPVVQGSPGSQGGVVEVAITADLSIRTGCFTFSETSRLAALINACNRTIYPYKKNMQRK